MVHVNMEVSPCCDRLCVCSAPQALIGDKLYSAAETWELKDLVVSSSSKDSGKHLTSTATVTLYDASAREEKMEAAEGFAAFNGARRDELAKRRVFGLLAVAARAARVRSADEALAAAAAVEAQRARQYAIEAFAHRCAEGRAMRALCRLQLLWRERRLERAVETAAETGAAPAFRLQQRLEASASRRYPSRLIRRSLPQRPASSSCPTCGPRQPCCRQHRAPPPRADPEAGRPPRLRTRQPLRVRAEQCAHG